MKPEVIYEDEALMVLGKPSGWITNEASTTKDTPVLQTWINENFEFDISDSKEFRSGIVHRLDKETSGIILVAKNEESFRDLQSQFKQRLVKKKYITLVHGKLVPEEGSVNAPVGRLPWNRERFGVFPGGKPAKSKYKVREHYKKGKDSFSLVEVFPETGRTHQIRVHMKYLDHAVVADTFYAGRKTSRKDRKWCPRLFLHASEISFKHPESGEKLSINSELPTDLEESLSGLE